MSFRLQSRECRGQSYIIYVIMVSHFFLPVMMRFKAQPYAPPPHKHQCPKPPPRFQWAPAGEEAEPLRAAERKRKFNSYSISFEVRALL